ncbi:hypothetical protein XENOCAPTIV_003933 [Xenoophorus captivus]|uniref:Secreted protein n=1 Tax=Xenoophorus captivus TaxID=1517983 RepID=A0ABV0QHG4_9TELE
MHTALKRLSLLLAASQGHYPLLISSCCCHLMSQLLRSPTWTSRWTRLVFLSQSSQTKVSRWTCHVYLSLSSQTRVFKWTCLMFLFLSSPLRMSGSCPSHQSSSMSPSLQSPSAGPRCSCIATASLLAKFCVGSLCTAASLQGSCITAAGFQKSVPPRDDLPVTSLLLDCRVISCHCCCHRCCHPRNPVHPSLFCESTSNVHPLPTSCCRFGPAQPHIMTIAVKSKKSVTDIYLNVEN